MAQQLTIKFDQEEIKVYTFLKDQYPDLADIYENFITKGRKGILNRLVGSFIREDVLGFAMHCYDRKDMNKSNIPQMDKCWGKVMEMLDESGLNKDNAYRVYPLYDMEYLIIPTSCFYAFRRTEITGDILHVSGNNIKKIKHAAEILTLMRRKEEHLTGNHQSQWGKLTDELRNGSANLAVSYAYWEKKKKILQQQASKYGVKSLIEYVLLRKQEDETFNSSLFFEQLTIEGHNLHPGTKTKIGINPQDVFHYSPEFEGKPEIHLVGIRNNYAEWSQADDNHEANTILFAEYPNLKEIVSQEFQTKGVMIDDYVFVPVHPWQMKNALPHIYYNELRDQIVVPVDSMKIPSSSTSSFRTVVPLTIENRKQLSMKLAVNSQMTSTVRSISTNTTYNAPIFTRLILEIMKKEPELARIFIPVCEVAGYNFKVDANEETQNCTLKSRNLSAVLRENIESFITSNEVAIVGSSLSIKSPITGKPIIVELIDIFAQSIGEKSLQKAAFLFLSEYVNIAISGYLTLMVKYGIGLEGHMQNSIPVFKDGKPIKMLFRDWGGVRIFEQRLLAYGITTKFSPHSITVTDRIKEMHNKVFYSLFQNHLGEIILQVIKYFGWTEKELWEEIIRICDNLFDSLELSMDCIENVSIDREALYQREVPHKALVKMRLAMEDKGYTYINVPNPMYYYQKRDL